MRLDRRCCHLAEVFCRWYTKHLVQARAARSHFGIEMSPHYDHALSLHRRLERERPAMKVIGADGEVVIGPLFEVLVSKNQVLRAGSRTTTPLERAYSIKPSRSYMEEFSMHVLAVDEDVAPTWLYVSGDSGTRQNMLPRTAVIILTRFSSHVGWCSEDMHRIREPRWTLSAAPKAD